MAWYQYSHCTSHSPAPSSLAADPLRRPSRRDPFIRNSPRIRRLRTCSALLTASPNTASISSSVRPRVSGTNIHVQTNESKQKNAKKRYVPAGVAWIRGGVISPWKVSRHVSISTLDAAATAVAEDNTHYDEVIRPVACGAQRHALAAE